MSATELTNKDVKCRERHRCEWCPDWIEAGEKAHFRAYKFDYDFVSTYQHPECYEAFLRLNWDEVGGEFERGSFQRGTCIFDGED